MAGIKYVISLSLNYAFMFITNSKKLYPQGFPPIYSEE